MRSDSEFSLLTSFFPKPRLGNEDEEKAMAEPLLKKEYYSKEEYLEMEALADCKSEFYAGEIFAMAGGSPKHSMICFNLYRTVGNAIADKDCIGFESNMKLELAEADAYVYPDMMIVCGEVKLAENTSDVITNPVLIVEVLSPATESFDRGKKFEYYRMLTSLKEYVLVSQEEAMTESFCKQDENTWLYTAAKGLDKSLVLKSLDYEIALKDIYHKIQLSESKT
jgi:Uma2 family endonuclease